MGMMPLPTGSDGMCYLNRLIGNLHIDWAGLVTRAAIFFPLFLSFCQRSLCYILTLFGRDFIVSFAAAKWRRHRVWQTKNLLLFRGNIVAVAVVLSCTIFIVLSHLYIYERDFSGLSWQFKDWSVFRFPFLIHDTCFPPKFSFVYQSFSVLCHIDFN
jgi:hypothetical protein